MSVAFERSYHTYFTYKATHIGALALIVPDTLPTRRSRKCQRQQPGSCEASTRHPSHPQRVVFDFESASNVPQQPGARCADSGLRTMELGRGLRAPLRSASCGCSSIRAYRLRKIRRSDLLWCGGVQCAGRRGRLWPRAAIGEPSTTRRRTQTILWLVSASPLSVRQRVCGGVEPKF